MTPVEIIALILIVVAVIKIIVIAIDPKCWLGVAKGIWSTPYLGIIYFILAAIVFYYLTFELTIVQILACTAFVALLMGLQFQRYSKDFMNFVQRMFKGKADIWKKNWIYIIIWIILLVLGLVELFG